MTLKLKLRDKQSKKDKTYVCDFLSLEAYEQANKVKKMITDMITEEKITGSEVLEEGIKMLISIYDDQFTFQEAVEGLSPTNVFEILLEHAQLCLGELKQQSLT